MIKKTIKIMFLFIFIMLFIYNVEAATTSLTASNQNVTTGTSVTVTGSVTAGAWNLNLSGNGTSKGLVGQTNTTDNMSASTSITFTPTTAGSYIFYLKGDVTDYYTDSTENVDKSITISVSEPTPAPTVSSNANLSNLGIRPSEYDFKGFRAGKTSYEVTVPNEVTSVEVYASKQDSKASITGTGQKKLQEGTNVFKVVVTAENGTTKTYQLNVIRQVASADVIPNTVGDTADSTGIETTIGLSKLEVKGMSLSPEFSVNTYRYIIELENEKITTLEQIKELITAEVNFEGGTFEITGSENLDKEENEVVISVKDADGREIAIYTLVFKIKKIEDTANIADETTGIIENEKTIFEKDKIIVIISIIIISFIALKSSITSYKQRKILQENGFIKTKEEYEDNENEIVEENINEKENTNEIVEEHKSLETKSNEEIKNDCIKDIFENSQMEFNPDDKDFAKKKKRRGKHS